MNSALLISRRELIGIMPTIKQVFGGTLLLLKSAFLMAAFGGNGYGYGQSPRQPVSQPQASYRLTMTECEGINNCTDWTFLSSNGWKAYAKWRTGEEAILELESAHDGSVTVHRTDVRGSKEGLTAVYTGTLKNAQVGGEFTSVYKGKSESGNWYALIGKDLEGPPSVMHWCALNCFTLNWEDGHYVAMDNGQLHPGVWTVESFTRESVLMRRTEPGATAIVSGHISSEGNSIVNGTITWISGPPATFTFNATWGTALNSLPGSNAERATQGPQSQAPQISARDVRDGVLEIKKWIDFFQLFTPNDAEP